MKSARELFDESQPPSAFDAHKESIRRQREQAEKDEDHPAQLIIPAALIAILIVSGIYRFGSADVDPAQEAYDRAKLECRISGGTYEYFGTQGYHCIGGKKASE